MAEHILLKPKGFRQHLENYWYHYKYHTLIGLFLAVTIAVCVTQCAMRVKPDYEAILCMNKYVPDAVVAAMEEHLELYGEDLNGDGKTVVQIVDASTSGNAENAQTQGAQTAKLMAELQLGEGILLITDQAKFDMLNEQSVFATADFLPDLDGKALNLNDTAFSEDVNAVYENFITHGVYLSLRAVEGTNLAGNEKVETRARDAEALVRRLLEAERTEPAS